jgi:hypothetical protein
MMKKIIDFDHTHSIRLNQKAAGKIAGEPRNEAWREDKKIVGCGKSTPSSLSQTSQPLTRVAKRTAATVPFALEFFFELMIIRRPLLGNRTAPQTASCLFPCLQGLADALPGVAMMMQILTSTSRHTQYQLSAIEEGTKGYTSLSQNTMSNRISSIRKAIVGRIRWVNVLIS